MMVDKFRLLTFACLFHQLFAQDIDSIVSDAVNSAFGPAGAPGTAAAPGAGFAAFAPRSPAAGAAPVTTGSGTSGTQIPAGRVRTAAPAAFGPGAGFAGGAAAPAGGRISSLADPAPPGNTGGGGGGAVRRLARFNLANDPPRNTLLEDRSSRAAQASRTIAANTGGTAAAFRATVDDPQITSSFQRAFQPFCYEIPFCDPSNPYRETSGECNNLRFPLLGKSFIPNQRILPAAYDNFIDSPRTRGRGNLPLPSARTVSNFVMNGVTPRSARFSTFVTHHGQFIDHDLIASASISEGTQDNPIGIEDCCRESGQMKFACFSIRVVQPGDPHFPPEQTCMHFVRHASAPPLDCRNGVREQVNQRSSFIDGTALYGFDRESENELRDWSLNGFGRLLESPVISGLLPPRPCEDFVNIPPPLHCLKAGDHRPSETPTLTVMHITWLRRHNLIADALRFATGITDNEVLFQEAKRIVVAELQHVTYNEFLPVILNEFHMRVFNLKSRPVGHVNVYNPNIDPRLINAFGVAAYRMGHSLVRNVVAHDNGRGTVQEFPLHEHFDNPTLMFLPMNGYEFMARWMSKARKSRSDRTLVDGIRNRLFEDQAGPDMSVTQSFDLGALNIQRGRDHGIPGYNAYRRWCGAQPAFHFAVSPGGLVDHSPNAAFRLSRAYRHVDDIDLFAGGISENPVPGGILGPTFSCIIAYQFSLLKHGDRFFYENRLPQFPLAAFTPAQLREIKQITYSKILCSVQKDDGGERNLQPKLMEIPRSPGNERRPCFEILGGNRLGFNIQPFAQQLLALGGRRRRHWPYYGGPTPLNPGVNILIQAAGRPVLSGGNINPFISTGSASIPVLQPQFNIGRKVLKSY